MRKWKTVAVLSLLVTLACAGAASAQFFTGFYDFADTQYTDDFHPTVTRRAQIKTPG